MSAYDALDPGIPYRNGSIDPRLRRDTRQWKYFGLLIVFVLTLSTMILLGLLIIVLLPLSVLILVTGLPLLLTKWTLEMREGSRYDSIIIISGDSIEFERYETKWDGVFHRWERLPLQSVASLEVESPEQNPEPFLREDYPTNQSVAWKMTITTFSRRKIELFRYPYIIIRTANDIHNLRSGSFGQGHSLGADGPGIDGNSEGNRSWPAKTSENDPEKNRAALVGALLFLGLYGLMILTIGVESIVLGSLFLISGSYFLYLYLEPGHFAPRRVSLDATGMMLELRSGKRRKILWGDISGMEDPVPRKECYVLPRRGRGILVSGNVAVDIGEAYRKAMGHYPALFVRYKYSSNASRLRRARRDR